MNTKQELQNALNDDATEEDNYSDPYCECGERLQYDPDNNWELSTCHNCWPLD